MFRTAIIKSLQAYLQARYTGPVKILKQEDDETLSGPYCLVRVGSIEDMGMGQAEIWDCNVLVAVMQDAEVTPIESAEAVAAALFATLADPEDIIENLSPDIAVSTWQPLTQEAAIEGARWQHVAGFRLVAGPIDPNS
jgi:hypothetical protein